MNQYDFQERLAFSTSRCGKPFETIIAETLPGILSVIKTDTDVDKTGIDYIATLRKGATIGIDLKLRDRGCSRYWQDGEEFALEIWSVIPDRHHKGKVGWTLDESKATDYTLHAFDVSDSDRLFLLPFQLLRKAFRMHFSQWLSIYRMAKQSSVDWKSECIFVPSHVVLTAIRSASITVIK